VPITHVKNGIDLLRNAHSLTNLKRKSKVKILYGLVVLRMIQKAKGVELINPQVRKIINEQKKLMPKYYQNNYYKGRNPYSENYMNCNL
jgi:hypothetical protein